MAAPNATSHHYNMPRLLGDEVAAHAVLAAEKLAMGCWLSARWKLFCRPKGFPYTMRLVSEIMSSNGPTSMASTCGTTFGFNGCGVPITEVIGGCAMGLVMDEIEPRQF